MLLSKSLHNILFKGDKMKSGENKLIFSMIFLVGVLLITSSFISATSNGKGLVSETVITGTVTYAESGEPVVGAKVEIKCGLVNNQKTKTDSNGFYSFDLLKKKCGKGNLATVVATKDGVFGFNRKVIASGVNHIDIEIGEVPHKTMITGVISTSDYKTPIAGADITVNCNEASKTTNSKADGTYFVLFDQEECDEEDTATVIAEKDGLTGSNSGVVHDGILGFLDVAVVNVPLVPEFGLIAGAMTILGAVGVFFVVRRK
jgi:hypothetical protein